MRQQNIWLGDYLLLKPAMAQMYGLNPKIPLLVTDIKARAKHYKTEWIICGDKYFKPSDFHKKFEDWSKGRQAHRAADGRTEKRGERK